MPRVVRTVRLAGLALGTLLAGMLAGSFFQAPTAAWGQGEQLVLSVPWARLRSKPAETSRSVAVVYGNDALSILERKDGWLRVRTSAKDVGWLSPDDASGTGPRTSTRPGGAFAAGPAPRAPARTGATIAAQGANEPAALIPTKRAATAGKGPQGSAVSLPPPPPLGGAPASPDTLRRMGYGEAARRKLTQVLLEERDNPMAYLATRDMLTYHPVGDLPPLQGGRIPPEVRGQANSLRVSVLLQEGQSLVKEGKQWDAVFLYQAMVQNDPDSGRAYLELLDLLTRIMVQAVNSPNKENLGLAASIWRNTYPDLPLPPMVTEQLSGKKK